MAMISSSEMCALAGCSYRQLDYWARARVVVPAIEARGTGSPRRFTHRQVRLVRLVTDLAALGAQQGVLQRAFELAELIPEDSWSGTAYVDMSGNLTLSPPPVPAWAIDLARCAFPGRAPVEQLSLA
jgi:DNA-binding transcriptional MerR regulator